MLKEKKNPAIMVIVLGLLLFSRTGTFAQTDSLKNYKIDEVVITATRSEKPISDIGRSVSVISKNDIKNSIYLSPSDILTSQEGINIIGNGQTPGSLQSIFMRGANSNQTVIMIDGLRITDPSGVENAVDLSELSLANIRKIEMVRGSHSTLYGSSAIGGVINFITEKNMKPGFNVDVNLRTGTFGDGSSDISENVLLNYTDINGFYFSGEIYNSKINGIDATVNNATDPNAFQNFDKDNFEKLDIIGKAGYTTNKIDAFLSFKKTDQKSDIDAGAFNDDDNYTIDFERNLFNYGASYKLNELLKLSFIGGYTDMKRVAINDSSVIDAAGTTDQSYFEGTYNGTVLNNELQANVKLKGIDAVIGGGIYKETMNNKTFFFSDGIFGPFFSEQDLDSLDINAEIKNVFLHVDINGSLVTPKLKDFSLALGSRYNDHSTFGSEFTYEINPAYKINENFLLFATFATGFNAPPLYRLYSPNMNFTSGITRGNKTLKPETSKSFEIGFKQILTDNISFSLSLFNTSVDNNIEYIYLWNKEKSIDGLDFSDYRGDTYLNVGKLITQGIELSVSSKITDKIFANVNYSYIDGNLEYSQSGIDQSHTQGHHVQLFSNGAFINRDIEQDELVRRSNTANFSLTYIPIDDLSLGLNVKYVGKKDDLFYDSSLGPYGALGTQDVADYTLFDVSTKYQVLQNLNAVLRIENIFDKEYTEIRGYKTRGRGFYLSLGYSL